MVQIVVTFDDVPEASHQLFNRMITLKVAGEGRGDDAGRGSFAGPSSLKIHELSNAPYLAFRDPAQKPFLMRDLSFVDGELNHKLPTIVICCTVNHRSATDDVPSVGDGVLIETEFVFSRRVAEARLELSRALNKNAFMSRFVDTNQWVEAKLVIGHSFVVGCEFLEGQFLGEDRPCPVDSSTTKEPQLSDFVVFGTAIEKQSRRLPSEHLFSPGAEPFWILMPHDVY
ncbi:hypothetical protein HG530_015052 [Fusarium avenaceum]|nr:hypothetical protein HG530_015052 [Fusarium avenaceum]